MKVLEYCVGERPHLIDMEMDYQHLKNYFPSGLFEVAYIDVEADELEDSYRDIIIVCDEEGKLRDLPLNRPLKYNGNVYDVLAGDFLACALDDEGEMVSLSEDEIIRVVKYFYIEDIDEEE